MHLCYIDESGTPEVPGNTSHFVLAGISIPIWHWHDADRAVSRILSRYGLAGEELHTAWLLRTYLEQSRIPGFEKMNADARRSAVERERNRHLLHLQKVQKNKSYRQDRKNYKKTQPYIHLTYEERKSLVFEVAACVSGWGFARLFGECVDKLHFDPGIANCTLGEQAFEQVISRFERYLKNIEGGQEQRSYGLIVHDNNQTVARKHTNLMKQFHTQGTLWTSVKHIIETPLFVDSSLTRMVQVADLCSYALRRYVENDEVNLFEHVFERADRFAGKVVGVRHFSKNSCNCRICAAHS